MQQGARLVQELGGERDAKLGGNDCYAPFAEPVSFVEVFGLLQPLSKTCLANDIAPAGLQCIWTMCQLVLVKSQLFSRSAALDVGC